MKFNFFKSKKNNNSSKQNEDIDDLGSTKTELAEYDKHVKFYYTNLINSLILFTYNSEQLDKMSPILIDPMTELYQEIDYAFTPVLFNTVFRNNLIDKKFKEDLQMFKSKVDAIPNEIWDWNFLDTHDKWKQIRNESDELLNKMKITSRVYNDEFTTIILSSGKVIKQGNKP
ncbi:MAG: hypothetical protein U0U67_14695 [Chitinophagales bacterium]